MSDKSVAPSPAGSAGNRLPGSIELSNGTSTTSTAERLERSVSKLEQAVYTLQEAMATPSPLEVAKLAGEILARSEGVEHVSVLRSWSPQRVTSTSARLAPVLAAELNRRTGYSMSEVKARSFLEMAIQAVQWSKLESALAPVPVRRVATTSPMTGVTTNSLPRIVRVPTARPINKTRSDQIKRQTHIVMWSLYGGWWLALFIGALILFNWANPGAGVNGITAFLLVTFMAAPVAFLCSLPIVMLVWHPRDHTEDDFPVIERPVLEDPPPGLHRPRPHLVKSYAMRWGDYPMTALLPDPSEDETWLNDYRFLSDEDIPQAVSDLCSEVVHNWNIEHPNAPASARRPAWFETMEEQARTLLQELQRAECVLLGDRSGVSDEEYFKGHGRWPDPWYSRRGMPIPLPGPDPDWVMSNPARALADAAVIAGAVYMGGFRPIGKAIKRL